MVNGLQSMLTLSDPGLPDPGDQEIAFPPPAELDRDPVDLQHRLAQLGRRQDMEIWVLLTHAVGDNDQCLALAEAFGRPFHCISLDWPTSSRALDRTNLKELLRDDMRSRILRHSIGLRAPWPCIIICSGRRADDVAFWIKRRSGGRSKVVTIGRAHAALAAYDLIVASPQYLLPEVKILNWPPGLSIFLYGHFMVLMIKMFRLAVHVI